jgi:D-alanine--D-alanine ligase
MNQYDHDHDRVRRRVAVIGGGANDEHEVSLASAAAVVRALRGRGDDVVALTIDRDGRWRRTDGPRVTAAEAVAALTTCDAAFPLLHGERGEDGAAAGLLVLVGVPIVGSPVRAGALAMDKWVTKVLAAQVGITTAPGSLVTTSRDVALEPPLVVKPTTGGSSNGVGVVHDRAALDDAVGRARAAGDGRVLVESFVVGREVDVALFRDRSGALRPGWTLEIAVAERSVFGRDEKYDGTADFTVPARITAAEHDSVLAAARRLYEVLGCAGVARFDFFVTADGVVLNEVNTTPGFTERSQVPLMYAATGLDYPDLVGELVEAALH